MKKGIRVLARVLIVTLVVTMFVTLPAQEAKAKTYEMTQPGIYTNKIVLDINDALEYYEMNGTVHGWYVYIRVGNGDWLKMTTLPISQRRVTIVNVSPNYHYAVRLYCDWTDGGGSYHVGDFASSLDNVAMAPAKVTGLKLNRCYNWSTYTSISTSWNKQSGTSGYHFQLYNRKGQCVKNEFYNSNSLTLDFLSNQTYRFRVRAFSWYRGSRKYGSWSNWIYIVPPTRKVSGYSNKKRAMTLKWSKVPGATSYTIMVATKSGGVYKASKTVSGKKTKATVKKIGKKKLKSKKYYYFYVRPNMKVNGKNKYCSGRVGHFTVLYGRVK